MMNKITLTCAVALLISSSQATYAQNWPQSEQAYAGSSPSSWQNNAPYQAPPQRIPPPYYGYNQGYAPSYNMPNPYPYYLPQVNVRQPGFMTNNQNNGWNNNNWNNNSFPNMNTPNFPNQNFNLPSFNMNDMPFMGNNGNEPWSNMPSMPNMDMPSPNFEFPTMNIPLWN